MLPFLISSAKSSKPTISAPAAFAASAFAPCVNTATRVVLPVPFGNTTEPRITWSDLRGSTPKLNETSIDSSNFAVAAFFTKAIASSSAYRLLASTVARIAFKRLETLAITPLLPYSSP